MNDSQVSKRAGEMACSSGFSKWNNKTIESFLKRKNTDLFYYPQDPEFTSFILYQSVLDEAEIFLVVVEKDKRGERIGTELMKKFLEFLESKGIRRVFLEVAVNNLPALRLYKHFGFKEISIREKYYRNLIDALVMERKL